MTVAELSRICEAVPEAERESTWFAMVPSEYMLRPPDSPEARVVLEVLCWHADANGNAWPSLRTLSKESGLHHSTVSARLVQLEAGGYVEIARSRGGRGHRNVYHLPAYAETRYHVDRLRDDETGHAAARLTGHHVAPLSINRLPERQSSIRTKKKEKRIVRASSVKKSAEAPEGYQALVDLFFRLFAEKHGETYTAVPRDFASLKTTLKRNAPAVMEAKLRRYFSEALWFNGKGSQHTLHGFCDHIADLLSGNGKPQDTASFITCRTCGVQYPRGTRCPACPPAEAARAV